MFIYVSIYDMFHNTTVSSDTGEIGDIGEGNSTCKAHQLENTPFEKDFVKLNLKKVIRLQRWQ